MRIREVVLPASDPSVPAAFHPDRYGSSRVADDIPRLVSLYRKGDLLLDELVSTIYPLAELSRAFADLEAGRLARGVLVP